MYTFGVDVYLQPTEDEKFIGDRGCRRLKMHNPVLQVKLLYTSAQELCLWLV